MNDEQLLMAEDLLRDAAELPQISFGLRARARAGAERAARRRLRLRRLGEALCLLLGFVALGVWLPATSQPADASAAQSGQFAGETDSMTPFANPSQLVTMASIGEWAHVECVVRLRSLHSQILQGGYCGFAGDR